MAQIISLLVDAIEDLLVTACQLDISGDDDSKALLVRAGRLQQDPTKNVVNILVHPNDPDAPDDWRHEIRKMDQVTLQNPWSRDVPASAVGMYEIGGGEHWWRRFTVELKMFFGTKNEDRATCRELAHRVLGRAEEALKEGMSTFGAQLGDWDEQCVQVYVTSSRCVERGGPTKDWIWDGKIWVQFHTAKP